MSPPLEHDHPSLEELLQQRVDPAPSGAQATGPQCPRCDLLDKVIEDKGSTVSRHGGRTPHLWTASKQAVRSDTAIPMDGTLATVNLNGQAVSVAIPQPVDGLLYVSFWVSRGQEPHAAFEEMYFPVQENGQYRAEVGCDGSQFADAVAVVGVLPRECAPDLNNADLDLVDALMARLSLQGNWPLACQLMKWARDASAQLPGKDGND